jgi:enterobacteria phage integrase
MPRKLPPHVELWRDRHGKVRVYFRRKRGPRIPLPPTVGSDAFLAAYQAALAGGVAEAAPLRPGPGSIAALITSYLRSSEFIGLRGTSKTGYMRRLEALRTQHGHRSVDGLSRERIITGILQPYADRPGAALDTLKKLRILIRHAINIGWLKTDPSVGIKRPRSKEIRAWSDTEMSAFEGRWPIGTKQRTAYELMLNVGTARIDVHRMTWAQFHDGAATYTRTKTGVAVDVGISSALSAALAAAPREHVTILNTEYGKPFTAAGFSNFMRDAIEAAGLPLECKPHGLRKSLGRRLADAGASAHDIMAALGHTTLAEAERYTREANRRIGGRRAVDLLDAQSANKNAQTRSEGLGNRPKSK